MTAARRWLWWTVVVLGLVLAVTGVWLAFNYRPSGAGFPGQPPRDDQLARVVHRVASRVELLVSFALAAVVIVQRWRRALPAVVTFVVVLALSVTGFLLPWEQLALYAVTVGTNFKGLVDAAFSDQVKFVIVDGAEVSKETIRNWFVVHAALLPVALAVCLAMLRRRSSSVGARTGA